MKKAKHNVLFKFFWGLLLLLAGFSLGYYYFIYVKVQGLGKDVFFVYKVLVGLTTGWGLILFLTNLFILMVYLYAKFFNKQMIEQKPDKLMSNAFFWWDAFDLSKVYKKLYPKSKNGYLKYVNKHFSFLENTYKYQFSFLTIKREKSHTGEYIVYRYTHSKFRKQIFILASGYNESFQCFITKNTNDLMNAFTNRQSWLSVAELFDFKKKEKNAFLALQDSITDDYPFNQLLAIKVCLKSSIDILETDYWPVTPLNEIYFLTAPHHTVSLWKQHFIFLENEFGFILSKDSTRLLPFEDDYDEKTLTYKFKDQKVCLYESGENEENANWSLSIYSDLNSNSSSGKGSILDSKEKIEQMIRKSI